ncbi:MAG: heavy metal translocating P-type ATPase [Deltaproteobacteria bacterium]
MNVLMLSFADYIYNFEGNVEIIFNYIKFVLAAPVLILLGLPILNSSLSSIHKFRFNIDSLIIIGSISAYLISTYSVFSGQGQVYFDTVTMLLVLLTLGRYLEANAKASSTNAIKGFLNLTPKTAIVLKNGIEQRVDSDSIEKYDLVKILPGESVPVDGEVVEGQSSVDESSLTGESVPVLKEIGSELYSGTINVDGSIIMKALEVGNNKTISRLVKLLEEARKSRAPIERIADKVASVFVPLIIVISVLTFTFWIFRSGTSTALMNSLSVLVISCPCALGIATPMAIWTALSRAASAGILVRSGSLMERLSHVNTVFFDKTGTLTKRELKLGTIFVDPDFNITESDVISMSASLESEYNHPLGKSILAYASEKNISFSPVTKMEAIPGMGIKGIANGKCIYAGSYRFMQSFKLNIGNSLLNIKEEYESLGMTVMLFAVNRNVEAVLGFREVPREETEEVIKEFKNEGIDTVILTGDNKYTASALSNKLNIDSKSELYPQEKVEIVQDFKNRGFTVAMVGDGINDAPALNAADVGIVLGCGSDITRESADISLMNDDLTNVPWIINLAKKTHGIIKQNLFWAFFYNVIGICIAVLGLLQPVIAAIAMIISSLIVLGNSLRIETVKIGPRKGSAKHQELNMPGYKELRRTNI